MRQLFFSTFFLGLFMMKMITLEIKAGNLFNQQDFEQNKVKSKQRSFEDFIGTSFVLIDADLLLIWMNNFQLCFCFHLASCPFLPAVLIISRGECRNHSDSDPADLNAAFKIISHCLVSSRLLILTQPLQFLILYMEIALNSWLICLYQVNKCITNKHDMRKMVYSHPI